MAYRAKKSGLPLAELRSGLGTEVLLSLLHWLSAAHATIITSEYAARYRILLSAASNVADGSSIAFFC